MAGCTCAPSLIQLDREVTQLYPARDQASDGCCGDSAHSSRASDHNPGTSALAKGLARALDIDEDVAIGKDLDWLVFYWWINPDPRIKYLIYEGFIYYLRTGTGPRTRGKYPYTGPNAHDHHLHVSIFDWAVRDMTPWLDNYMREDIMTPNQERKLDDVLNIVQLMHSKNFQHGSLKWLDDRVGPIKAAVDKIKTKVGA